MPLQHSALIGTSQWNPIGESVPSIVQRICRCNHMSLRQFGVAVSEKTAQFFLDGFDRDPNRLTTVSKTMLCKHAGWSADALDASLIEWYLWNSDSNEFSFRFQISEPATRLYSQIRLCPQCAAEGVHLVFHQLPGWCACPLHDELLISACPVCSTKFNPFQFDGCLTQCAKCGWGAHPRLDVDLTRRGTVLAEFRQWIDEVQSVVLGQNASRIMLGCPDPVEDIASVLSLVPGPTWLATCLSKTERVRIDTNTNMELDYQHPDGKLIEKLPIFDHWNKPRFQGTLVSKAEYRAAAHIVKMNKRIRGRWTPEPLEGLGVRRVGHDRLRLSISEKTSMTQTAWWLWRACVDGLFTPEQRWFVEYPPEEFTSCFLWRLWRGGPGRLAWRNKSAAADSWNNDELLHWADKHWQESLVLHLFHVAIGRAGLVFDRFMYKRELSVVELFPDFQSLVRLPVSVLEFDRHGVQLNTATTLAERPAFEDFIAADFPGRQYRSLATPSMQEPLFDLLGVDKSVRSSCYNECELWGNRQN